MTVKAEMDGQSTGEKESNGQAPSPTTQDLRDISQFLPLYVIPLSNLENLAGISHARFSGSGEGMDGAAAVNGVNGESADADASKADKPITINIVVPQSGNEDTFQMPVGQILIVLVAGN